MRKNRGQPSTTYVSPFPDGYNGIDFNVPKDPEKAKKLVEEVRGFWFLKSDVNAFHNKLGHNHKPTIGGYRKERKQSPVQKAKKKALEVGREMLKDNPHVKKADIARSAEVRKGRVDPAPVAKK